MQTEVIVIGAGPIGIEVASALKLSGIPYLHFESGPLGKTITRWPQNTRFFSSPERDAIAGIPLQTENQEAVTGDRYLSYLRSVVEIRDLDIRLFEDVLSLKKKDDFFHVVTRNAEGEHEYSSRYVVLATGNMATAKTVGIPGEELPHVSHFPEDPHRYFRQKLLVVGGKNSALETALRCFRAGSRVTISYRRAEFDKLQVYSRLYLEVRLLIEKGLIRFMPLTCLSRIDRQSVEFISTAESGINGADGGRFSEDFDFVLLCTGFRADFRLYRDLGVQLNGGDLVPQFNPETMETNIPGAFIAGTAAGGNERHHGYFIGTCHDHAVKIVSRIAGVQVDAVGTVPSRRYQISLDEIEAE